MNKLKILLRQNLIHNCAIKRFLSSHNNHHEKSRFRSSLYLSTREESFSVTKPAFDKTYLQDVVSNLDEIKENMALRGIPHDGFNDADLKKKILEFADEGATLKKVRKRHKKLIQWLRKTPEDEKIIKEMEICKNALAEIRSRFFALEDAVVPFLLNIPAPIDDSRCGQIVGETPGTLPKEVASKLGSVNHLRLGYFNNALQPSIVGPDAHYFTKDGAETYHAMTDYLLDLFDENGYQQFCGMDLVKSAVVEAVDSKPVNEDPFLLNDDEPEDYQRLHLAGEGSLSALVAFLISQESKLKPCKIVQHGSSYNDHVSQTHSLSATIIENQDKIAEAEEDLYRLWWNAFKSIGFRCRSYYVPLEELKKNQSSKLVIAVWLYSQQQFIPIFELCNHSNYILRRAGIADSSLHMLHSNLDMLPLIKCWLEHFQDPVTGKVSRPEVLKSYYLSL